MKEDTVGDRVVEPQNFANKLFTIYAKRLSPVEVPVGRDSAAAGLELGNERIIVRAHLGGELPLGKASSLS